MVVVENLDCVALTVACKTCRSSEGQTQLPLEPAATALGPYPGGWKVCVTQTGSRELRVVVPTIATSWRQTKCLLADPHINRSDLMECQLSHKDHTVLVSVTAWMYMNIPWKSPTV